MSNCDCGGGNHFHEHKGIPHGCNRINHVFDPNPPAFYGTWNNLYGFNPTSRVSMAQPGIETGLYRVNGPLHFRPCQNNITMLTGVETLAKISLLLKFNYTNSMCNTIVELNIGKLYTVKYLEDGMIKGCTGLCTNIYKVEQLNENQAIYKIRFDCSTNYSNNVVVVKSDQIRELKEYVPYQDEDVTLTNATHTYATTLGKLIENVVIENAELDENKNIITGIIKQGNIIEGKTIDGIISGTNNSGHNIIMRYGHTTGGNITEGIILSGIVRKGEIIDGIKDEKTGKTRGATVKGTVAECMITNSKVTGAKTTYTEQAIVIDPTIKDGRLFDATISGNNMVTKGGVTVGNITTGGITIGGNATGGTAVGYINNECFSIIDGTTTVTNPNPFTDQEIENFIKGNGTNTKDGILNTGITGINTSGRLITQNGTLVGGTVMGGIKMGNAIYGAVIIGGTVSGGVTTGGITTTKETPKGKLILGFSDTIKDNGVPYDRNSDNYIKHNPSYSHENNWYGWYKKCDDLLLMTDKATHTEFYTNFGTAVLERVPHKHKHW